MNNFKNILANKPLRNFLAGALVVLIFLGQCSRISNLSVKLDSAENVANRNFENYLAARDTIQSERNQNNELVSLIRSYEFEVNSLEKDNNKLLDKYKAALSLNKKYIEINNLISTELEIKDSIIASGIVSKKGDTLSVSVSDQKEWDKYNWRSFNGQIDLLKIDTTYNLLSSNFNLNQGVSLKMAIVEESGTSFLRVSSPYPNLIFTNIENINLVNDRLNAPAIKKAGWSVGLGIGYGLNIQGSTMGFGPTIGVGLYYSPKWLRF